MVAVRVVMDWLGSQWGALTHWFASQPTAVFSVASILLTAGTFYMINLRRGHLRVGSPQGYEIAIFKEDSTGKPIMLLHLPLIFYNTGAIPILVQDMRLLISDEHSVQPFRLEATLPHLTSQRRLNGRKVDQPEWRVATQFPVRGREAVALVYEFWGEPGEITLLAARHYPIELQVRMDNRDAWETLHTFTLRISQKAIDKYKLGDFYPFRNEDNDSPIASGGRVRRIRQFAAHAIGTSVKRIRSAARGMLISRIRPPLGRGVNWEETAMASHIVSVSDIPAKNDKEAPKPYTVISADSDGKAVVNEPNKDHKPQIVGGPKHVG